MTAHQGCVTVRGPILAREVERLLKMVQAVRGVHAVNNQLELTSRSIIFRTCKGEAGRGLGEVPELWQTNWTPAVRVLMSTAGGTLALCGLAQRGPLPAWPQAWWGRASWRAR